MSTATMATATLTSKGQLTVPKAVRDALGLATGDKLRFVTHGTSFLLEAASDDAQKLKGMFAGRRKQPATLAEIKASAAHGAARRYRAASK